MSGGTELGSRIGAGGGLWLRPHSHRVPGGLGWDVAGNVLQDGLNAVVRAAGFSGADRRAAFLLVTMQVWRQAAPACVRRL